MSFDYLCQQLFILNLKRIRLNLLVQTRSNTVSKILNKAAVYIINFVLYYQQAIRRMSSKSVRYATPPCGLRVAGRLKAHLLSA